MDLHRAITIAVDTMNAEIHKIAFDANACDRLGLSYPQAIGASRRRKELLAAIDVIAGVESGKPDTISEKSTLKGGQQHG